MSCVSSPQSAGFMEDVSCILLTSGPELSCMIFFFEIGLLKHNYCLLNFCRCFGGEILNLRAMEWRHSVDALVVKSSFYGIYAQ
jgi:hypothetical protein